MVDFARIGLVMGFLAMTACDSSESDATGGAGGTGPFPDPEPLPALTRAPLTTEEILVPEKEQAAGALDPRFPEDVTKLLDEGYGDMSPAAGEPVGAPRTLDDSTAPAPGSGAKMIARFVHLADTQLADDESPARVCDIDSPQGLTSGAFRPQEGHECRILNAAVRTINKLNETMKLDLVVLGGDNADNAQTNEIDWFLSILNGSKRVECDSGADDDPTPGPANDPKDPFFAEGLAMPWFWVTGNHDVLNQGNFPPLARAGEYTGEYSGSGSRDWSMAGGPIASGDWIADPRRTPLDNKTLLAKLLADGRPEITQDVVDYGRAYYTFDVPNTPLRFVVVDTASATGSADGLITQGDVDLKVKPALDKAATDGKIVIVTSHHSAPQLTDGGGLGGMAHPDAVLGDAWRDVLGDYDNVLMHLCGHTHHHKVVKAIPAMGNPYWELETAAIADFPHQMRVIEIWDQDNGFYAIRAIALDYQTENDDVAIEGRKIGVSDFTSGWQNDGRGKIEDRNVELLVRKP